MFQATIVDGKRWRDILRVISTVVSEPEFSISSEGMRLKAFDNSRTTLINLQISDGFFDRYECDKACRLRFRAKAVLDILDTLVPNESLVMTYSEEQAVLVISLKGDYLRVFNLNTFATEPDLQIDPAEQFDTKAIVLSSNLRQALLDAQNIGDQLIIQASKDKIFFKTIGLTGNVVSTFAIGEECLVELTSNEETRATYNLEFLAAIVKNAVAVTEKLQIEFSTDRPLKLGMFMPQAKIQVYLSPRIDVT